MTEQKGNVVIPKSRVEEIFGTPKECFDFLTIEVGYHLPDRPYCDMNWMSQIWDGSRKAILTKNIDMRRIPSIKHLRTADILAFLKEWGSELYLQPKKKKAISEKWSRKWLCQVSAIPFPSLMFVIAQVAQTLHPSDFRKLVGTTMTERRERLLEKRGLFVNTAPEIAEAIERTKLFSST